jgi:Tol biopolymer transport system component
MSAAKGTNLLRLTTSPGNDLNPSWSPDGTKIAFTSKRTGNNEIFVMNADGTGQVDITNNAAADNQPAWSPDGTEILFNREHKPSHLGRLFVVHPDGTGMTRISPFGLLIHEEDCAGVPADWSPDGSQVTFAASLRSGEREGTAVFVMNSDGTGLHRVTPYGENGIAGATWSPDGTTIVFSAVFLTRHHLLWSVHPDGTGLSELTPPTNGDSACGPVWSPNGAKIAFVSFHPEISGGQEDLWSIRSDGTGLFQITDTPEYENNPQWGSAPVG